jgi:hypothetical protein
MTDGQSASQSWCHSLPGPTTTFLLTVRQLWFCRCGAPSLTRARIFFCRGHCPQYKSILFNEFSYNFCDGQHSVFFWIGSIVPCHDLLKYPCTYSLYVSFAGELFALGVWTDWLGTWCTTVAVQACANEGDWGCCSCRVLLRNAAAEERAGVVLFEESNLPGVHLGALCDILFRISSLGCLQPRHVEGW